MRDLIRILRLGKRISPLVTRPRDRVLNVDYGCRRTLWWRIAYDGATNRPTRINRTIVHCVDLQDCHNCMVVPAPFIQRTEAAGEIGRAHV